MKLEVSGGGSNPNKIMYAMGMLFVVLGLIIGLPWLIFPFAVGIPFLSIGGILFMAVFCGVGGFFAYIGKNGSSENREILADGTAYMGKIYGYEDDPRVTMNGAPCITLVVRYMRNGEISEARVNTGEVNAARYPIGATISFKLLNGVAAMVPNSVCDIELEHERDLMNPDFSPYGISSSINVSCPNCSANVVIPLGMSRYCPYCDTKVSLDAEGRLIQAH